MKRRYNEEPGEAGIRGNISKALLQKLNNLGLHTLISVKHRLGVKFRSLIRDASAWLPIIT